MTRTKSRNQLRLARRAREYATPGTIQYQMAQRNKRPRVRRWMKGLKPEVFARLMAFLEAGGKARIVRGGRGPVAARR